MLPKSYCSKLGGDYQPWNAGDVAAADLHRWSPDNDRVYIRGVLVYGLYFETETGPKRWNCRIGWEEKGML